MLLQPSEPSEYRCPAPWELLCLPQMGEGRADPHRKLQVSFLLSLQAGGHFETPKPFPAPGTALELVSPVPFFPPDSSAWFPRIGLVLKLVPKLGEITNNLQLFGAISAAGSQLEMKSRMLKNSLNLAKVKRWER